MSQKIVLFVTTTVRTSNPTVIKLVVCFSYLLSNIVLFARCSK
jgi:hypothetical protein